MTVALLVTTCVLALLALVATVRGRPIDNPMFYLTIAIEVLLVIQSVSYTHLTLPTIYSV